MFLREICTKGLLSLVGNLSAFQKNAIMLDLEAQFQGHVIQDGRREPKFHIFFIDKVLPTVQQNSTVPISIYIVENIVFSRKKKLQPILLYIFYFIGDF
jgi:hypothetical protein